jgi:hypothetical protein
MSTIVNSPNNSNNNSKFISGIILFVLVALVALAAILIKNYASNDDDKDKEKNPSDPSDPDDSDKDTNVEEKCCDDSQECSPEKDNCYMWNDKKWSGEYPSNPTKTKCGYGDNDEDCKLCCGGNFEELCQSSLAGYQTDTCYMWNDKKWSGEYPSNPTKTKCGYGDNDEDCKLCCGGNFVEKCCSDSQECSPETDNCYMWNDEKWSGIYPSNPKNTECGNSECNLCCYNSIIKDDSNSNEPDNPNNSNEQNDSDNDTCCADLNKCTPNVNQIKYPDDITCEKSWRDGATDLITDFPDGKANDGTTYSWADYVQLSLTYSNCSKPNDTDMVNAYKSDKYNSAYNEAICNTA